MKLLVLSCVVALAAAAPTFPFTSPPNFWAQLDTNPPGTNFGLCNGWYGLPGSANTNVGPKAPAYTRKLWVMCVHDIYSDTVTGAHIHLPAGPGGANPVPTYVATVNALNQNPIYSASTSGSGGQYLWGFDLTGESDERALFSGITYINVHTTGSPNGYIRGQLYPYGFGSYPSGVTEPTYAAQLDDSQEIPVATVNNISRSAVVHIRRVAGTSGLAVRVVWAGLQVGTEAYNAAHIHTGTVGNTGGVAAAVCTSVASCSGSFYNSYPAASVTDPGATAMANGGTYFNMHTSVYPNGAIRGQIYSGQPWNRFYGDDSANFWASLTGTAAKTGSSATGFAVAYYNTGSRELRIYAIHNSANPATAMHIHGPASTGHDGGVICGLTGTGGSGNMGFWSTAPGSCFLNAMTESALYNGLTYVNVHNAAFPGGEIRGQLMNSAASGAPTHVALLNDLQSGVATPTNTVYGRGGIAWFTCGASSCTGNFMWAGVAATAAHVHGPTTSVATIDASALSTPGLNPELNAAPKDVLCSSAATCGGNAGATQSIMNPTLTFTTPFENYYVNVHSTAFGNGEIRGQIRAMAAAAPTRVVSASGSVNTDAVHFYAMANTIVSGPGGGNGLCAATLNSGTSRLWYTCVHNCPAPSAAHFHGTAAPGTFNAGVWKSLTIATNPSVIAGFIDVTAAEITNLMGAMYYFNVHNGPFPGGCATGTLYPAGMGASAATTPTHAAVLDLAQSGFGPTNADANFKAGAIGVMLIMAPSTGTTFTTWQQWTGMGFVPTAAHIHGTITGTGNQYFPEQGGNILAIDYQTGVTTSNGNTTNTLTYGGSGNPVANSGSLDSGSAYVNFHGPAPYATSALRGQINALQALPVGTPTVPTSSSSTGGSSGSSSGPAAAAHLVASFALVVLLSIAAVLFQ